MVKAPTISSEQLEDLKKTLEQRYDLLRKQENLKFGVLVKTAKEGIDHEQEEFSTSDPNAPAEQDLAQRHSLEMQGIEHAVSRMNQGSFGVCIDCQSTIDFSRLLAYPTALRCMNCQEAFELRERHSRNQGT